MQPMLATAVAALPRGPQWRYEFKWDGVRVIVAPGPRLTSRLGNDVTGGYPELVTQFAGLGDTVLDGEIVALAEGRPSFEALQARMHLRGTEAARAAAAAPVTCVLFDLLRLAGQDLTTRPWADRRSLLQTLAGDHPDWTLSPAFDDLDAVEQVARAQSLEGVLAKRDTSPYRPGIRSADWVKLRFVRSGEFVVIGWEAARDHPATPSSLLLAVASDTGLRYAGKVGSGLTGRVAATLRDRFEACDDPVVDGAPHSPGRVSHWVLPSLVVEVEFHDRTSDGRLRHPVFRGVRDDKTVPEATG